MPKQWKLILTQSWILTRANLKTRYRNSAAGYLWVLLSPLSTYLAQAYVFKIIFKVEVENYFLFLLFGLMPWLFFSQTLDMVTTSFFHNGKLLKSVKVHPLSLILSQALDNLITSIGVMLAILLLLQFFFVIPWGKIYLFPIPYLFLGCLATSIGFFLSALHVQFHDVKFVISFVLSILYLISPVLYPEKYVPEKFKFLIVLNPLYYVLRPWRSLLENGPASEFWIQLLVSGGIVAVFALLTFIYWKKKRNVVYLKL